MTQKVLQDKHAVVTGGSRGLGAAIASALAAEGARVTVMGRTAATIERQAELIRREHGARTAAIVCDVADETSVQYAFAEAVRGMGPVQILTNSAGQADAAFVQDTSVQTWERILRVNLTGTFLCVQQVLAAMTATGNGRIVNIASTAGLRGYARVGAYVASKHGVIGLTRTLALETARTGVTVNAVCPGYTEDTDMLRTAIKNVMRATGKTDAEARASLVRQSPRGRFVTVKEVAETVVWLCSPAASAITGQAIAVAAGEVM
jgi:NAD(P)-dependent dehydrogenase (short-subunit alcohol dehydrogenase family)